MKYDQGLTVMRGQPLHIGHFRLIDKMLEECESVTIVLGSTQEFNTKKNPFPFSERKQMLRNCFTIRNLWGRIRVIGLKDIHNEMKWPDYVLENVKEYTKKEKVDAYYCGTEYDGHWFEGKVPNIIMLDRTQVPFVSGSMVREMLMYRHPDWKKYIPECNWELVEKFFYKNGE